MRKFATWFMVLGFCFSTFVLAASNYKAGGCGLGSMWFEGDSLTDQVLASTTNGTSGNQTFGMTSGTSNCNVGDSSDYAIRFIDNNRVALENDAARGYGETINTLAQMMGVKDVKIFSLKLQKNFETIFKTKNSQDIYSILKTLS